MRLSMNGIRVNNTAASASAIASMGGYGCKKYNVPGGDAEEFKAGGNEFVDHSTEDETPSGK